MGRAATSMAVGGEPLFVAGDAAMTSRTSIRSRSADRLLMSAFHPSLPQRPATFLRFARADQRSLFHLNWKPSCFNSIQRGRPGNPALPLNRTGSQHRPTKRAEQSRSQTASCHFLPGAQLFGPSAHPLHSSSVACDVEDDPAPRWDAPKIAEQKNNSLRIGAAPRRTCAPRDPGLALESTDA